jgi:hypothetical protein
VFERCFTGYPYQAQILGVDAPDLYVRQNPSPNAYTLAINGKKPFVVVHTSLIELLTPAELQVSQNSRDAKNSLFPAHISGRFAPALQT